MNSRVPIFLRQASSSSNGKTDRAESHPDECQLDCETNVRVKGGQQKKQPEVRTIVPLVIVLAARPSALPPGFRRPPTSAVGQTRLAFPFGWSSELTSFF